ncbi:MAG: hypothetical protein HC880_07430 [Bacteroidia bacterium]|nr:hypothetical protein [Bacteroidia bacterium]
MSENLLLAQLAEKLASLADQQFLARALLGLDGYVDKIQKVIRAHQAGDYEYFGHIGDFAAALAQAAGKSAQIGLVTQEVKLGGNAPIMAHALGRLGIANTCLGTFGWPETHPVFQQISSRCQLVSLGQPAETNALEFDDGKLIFSETESFRHLDWPTVRHRADLVPITNPPQQLPAPGPGRLVQPALRYPNLAGHS